MIRRVAILGVLSLVAAVLPVGLASADTQPSIAPEMVEVAINPGGSFDVEKTVVTPEFPPMLDFVLAVDLSGSYHDDLPNIKGMSFGLCTYIKGHVADSRFGLVTFVDYPYLNWGNPTWGDYAYRLDQDLTADCTTWDAAVQAMGTRNGSDFRESQFEALYQLATGTGRDVPGSVGDISSGLGITFRSDSTRVVALTTDAAFHTTGDSNCVAGDPDGVCPFAYPGPNYATTLGALTAHSITFVGIWAGTTGSEPADMANLASDTEGSVVYTSDTSEEIGDAIIEGLSNLPIRVSMTTDCALPLNAAFAPVFHDVTSGDTVTFTETISVAPDADPGVYHCRDWVLVDGEPMVDVNGEIVYEHKWITVAEPFCIESHNPSGENVPKAPGKGGQGQNQDGFYAIGAYPEGLGLEVFVMDDGSGTVFGPFVTTTDIKYTEANGADPSIKPGSGDVDFKIKGQGDAIVLFVDALGNALSAPCLVPPPPD